MENIQKTPPAIGLTDSLSSEVYGSRNSLPVRELKRRVMSQQEKFSKQSLADRRPVLVVHPGRLTVAWFQQEIAIDDPKLRSTSSGIRLIPATCGGNSVITAKFLYEKAEEIHGLEAHIKMERSCKNLNLFQKQF